MSGVAPTTAAQFRRFVAEHHPDRGGDAEVFAAGVHAYRLSQRAAGVDHPAGTAPVVFYRKRTVPAHLLERLRTLPRPRRRGGASERRCR